MDNNILNSIYIGNIKKNHKGGYKIINDTEDKNIIQTRNYILGELSSIFNGGKELEYKDIPHYIQALEGKYFRNKMCKGGSSSCKGACDLVKKSYSKLVKKSVEEFNNPNLFKIIKGGSQYLYKKIGEKYRGGTNKIYIENGSYGKYSEDDNEHFNTVMRENCGDECTSADNTNVDSVNWGITRDTEMKIKRINDEDKEWLINHWIYADNHYKINLIIILLEDAYVNNKKNNINSNIVYIAREFILYHTCSGVISTSVQSISINFYNIARNLREVPEINEILIKLKRSSTNNIDDFCETQNYNESNFSKGGSESLKNHYTQNGGNNLTNLRNEIDQIRYPFKYTKVIDKIS